MGSVVKSELASATALLSTGGQMMQPGVEDWATVGEIPVNAVRTTARTTKKDCIAERVWVVERDMP